MKRIKVVGIILICLMLLSIILYYLYLNYYISPIPIIENVNINDENKLIIKYKLDENRFRNKIHYIVKNDNVTPSINDKWILSKNNEVSIDLEKNMYYIYLKNEDNKIIKVNNTENLGKITSLNI